MGGINIPPPQYVFINRGREGEQQNREEPNVDNIVNDLLRSFMDIFTGHEFMRMRHQYSDINPNDFMSNFQQSFDSDALFEIVRRMSEAEASRNQRSKKAKKSAVEKLP